MTPMAAYQPTDPPTDPPIHPFIITTTQAIKHADDPFGQEAADDTTGLGIWCAALVLARWLASDAAVQALLEGSVVCELGAGCGVPGLAAALHGRPREVFLTDLNPETVANLRSVSRAGRQSVSQSVGRSVSQPASACVRTRAYVSQTHQSPRRRTHAVHDL